MAREASHPSADRGGRTVKAPGAFRTISEVAGEIDVPQHVLRFWETKFNQIRPLKRAGGRRYYRPEDVALLGRIRGLLYEEGYTIKGVQKLLRTGGLKALEHQEQGETQESAEAAGETEAGQAVAQDAAGREADVVSERTDVAPEADRGGSPPPASESASADEARQLRAELRKLRSELVTLRDMLRTRPKR